MYIGRVWFKRDDGIAKHTHWIYCHSADDIKTEKKVDAQIVMKTNQNSKHGFGHDLFGSIDNYTASEVMGEVSSKQMAKKVHGFKDYRKM